MLIEEFNTLAAMLAHLAPDMHTISRKLDEMRSGYPSKTVGASNTASGSSGEPDPDDIVQLTATERAGIDRATGHDRIACDSQEIRELITSMIAMGRRLNHLCGPYRHSVTPTRTQALTEAPSDWCTSCYRDGQHHTPVSIDQRGRKRYEDLCRWCGDFKTAHDTLPTMPVLRAHHEGRRITVQMVERSIGRKTKR